MSIKSQQVQGKTLREENPRPYAFQKLDCNGNLDGPPPNTILNLFPLRWAPYADLARIHKPGVIVIWVTHFCGLFHAASLRRVPLQDLLPTIGVFLVACQLLMCINFAWNDICDVEFDRQVPRCRWRPLARGALSYRQAVIFNAALVGMIILFLPFLPLPCTIYSIPLAYGSYIYPLSKRFTNFPQIVLGVVLAGGVFIGAAAAGVAAIPYPASVSDIFCWSRWTHSNQVETFAVVCNYLASVIWTILYETVYSYSDAKWDANAGVGTITRVIRSHNAAKVFLTTLAIAQTALHSYIGGLMPLQTNQWAISTYSMAGFLALEVFYVDLNNVESCLFWFKAGNVLAGTAMLGGYVAEYISVVE